MGDLVVERLRVALEALGTGDELRARRVRDGDFEINDLYLELESECIDLFALQQPVAGDLRFIAASFKIITDLERIADLATNLAEYAVASSGGRNAEVDVQRIGSLTAEMVGDAVAAFERGDVRDLERVGDHAVDIAAGTLYMVENDDALLY